MSGVVYRSGGATEGWVDYQINAREGAPRGKALFLQQTGTNGLSHLSGIAVVQPSVVEKTSEVDESLVVLEGHLRLEFDDGSTIEAGVRDMIYIPAGTNVTWHFLTPFKEMFFASTYQRG